MALREKYPQLHLDNQLCFGLYSMSRLVTQAYAPLLKPLDITYPQYLVFMVLWQRYEQGVDSVAVKQLTEELMLDTGTVTPLLKRMEAKGMLQRQRSQEDERIVLVSLTEQGIALRERAKDIPVQLFCQSGLEQSDISDLKMLLQKLAGKMNPGK